MRNNISWIGCFLILYTLHSILFLIATGQLIWPVPDVLAQLLSILSLILLCLLVWVFMARKDEVLRRLSLQAGAVSMAVTALTSYVIAAFGLGLPLLVTNLWALSIMVFLVVYGVLVWRAQS